MNNWKEKHNKNESQDKDFIIENSVNNKENTFSELIEDKNGGEMIDDSEKTLKNLREEISGFADAENEENINEKKIEEYINKHTPVYLRKEKPSAIYELFRWASGFLVKEVQGKEKLPEGPKLFIVNHRGGETGRLIAALDERVSIAAGKDINWQRNKTFQWLLKKLGMIPIKESFSNLSSEQIQEVIKRSPEKTKEEHKKVAQGLNSLGGNIQNIKTMAALLLQGKDVAILAEGPFSRLEDDERKAYAGYALVAREYKSISGRELDIIPTGIRGSKVSFGESFNIDKYGKQSKEDLQGIATTKIHELYDSLGQ